jgi:hypothetical protein
MFSRSSRFTTGTIVSIHALHEMFCQDFAGSNGKVFQPAIKTLLHEGAVPNPGRADVESWRRHGKNDGDRSSYLRFRSK